MSARYAVAASCLSILVCAAARSVAADTPASSARPAALDAAGAHAIVTKYCVTCHNERLKTAGLLLDRMDIAHPGDAPEVWEKVVRKLQTRVMPPASARRPDEATYTQLQGWLESQLDRAAAVSPNPGRPLLHRLNRAEYANAIRDLLDLDVDTTSLLPPDDAAYGFDNIADVLGVSPVLMERYLSAAGKISALAVGDPAIAPGADTYRVRQDLSQDQRIDGLPLGTVGGLAVRHQFPLDGEYRMQVTLFRNNTNTIRGLESAHQLEISIDGERVLLKTIGGGTRDRAAARNVEAGLRVSLPLHAGPHDVVATFLRQTGVTSERIQPFLRSSIDTFVATGRPHIETLTITGPFNPTGPGDTPSRRRIFVCRPSRELSERACATKIVSLLARRAYRRPTTADDVQPLLTFYDLGRRKGTFDAGIQMALRRVLASPKFVFRGEHEPANLKPGDVYALTGSELASRLSFWLWSSIPDDHLLAEAQAGTLSTGAGMVAQVRLMLADPRASALTTNFAGQWLHLRNLRSIVPNSSEFPDFDDNLRQGLEREAELFFRSIVTEDRSVLDLMTADYTFLNERVAKLYGIPGVYGTQFRRVHLTDDARRGLLGKGAVLMVTSHPDRTSPVVRGKWVLENLVGLPPAPPPPNVPPLKDRDAGAQPRTMRQQMEEHRASPVCAGCHKVMDPIGFALENFDAVGAWRTSDGGAPIDASGQLADGTRVEGVVALREALVKRPEIFVGTFTEKLLTYALGRGLTADDMPAVRRIVREAAADNYRFSSLVAAIARSTPFRLRVAPPHDEHPAETVARTAAH